MKIRVEFIRQRENEEPKTVKLLFGSIEEYSEWARCIHYHNMISIKVETIA